MLWFSLPHRLLMTRTNNQKSCLQRMLISGSLSCFHFSLNQPGTHARTHTHTSTQTHKHTNTCIHSWADTHLHAFLAPCAALLMDCSGSGNGFLSLSQQSQDGTGLHILVAPRPCFFCLLLICSHKHARAPTTDSLRRCLVLIHTPMHCCCSAPSGRVAPRHHYARPLASWRRHPHGSYRSAAPVVLRICNKHTRLTAVLTHICCDSVLSA